MKWKPIHPEFLNRDEFPVPFWMVAIGRDVTFEKNTDGEWYCLSVWSKYHARIHFFDHEHVISHAKFLAQILYDWYFDGCCFTKLSLITDDGEKEYSAWTVPFIAHAFVKAAQQDLNTPIIIRSENRRFVDASYR